MTTEYQPHPARLAHLVELDADPHEESPDEIRNMVVLRTLVVGRNGYPA